MNNDAQSSKIKFSIIITIILAVIGVINLYYNLKVTKAPHILSIIFGFIPAIIAVYKLLKLLNDREGTYVFFNAALAILSVFFIICGMVSTMVLNKFSDVSDYNDYEKVLNYEKKSSGLFVNHFPSEIPSDASDKEFKEWGNSGKDSMGMTLSYHVDGDLKDKIVENVISNSKYYTVTKNGIDEIADKMYVPDYVYEKLGLKSEKASSDFEYYVLDSSLNDTDTKSKYSYGLIIDNDNKKVTYYTIKEKF